MVASNSLDDFQICPEIWGPLSRSISPKRVKMPLEDAQLVPEGATTFESFFKLPFEIRLKIWRLSMPGPRTVRLKPIHRANDHIRVGYNDDCALKAYARYLVPALLHANYEARQVALAYYVAAFGDRLVHPVYFNFKIDTLYGDPTALLHFGKTDDMICPIHTKYVRRLVASGPPPNVSFIKSLLKPFASLETVTIEPKQFPWLFPPPNLQLRAQQLIGTWTRIYPRKTVPKFYQLRPRDMRETRTAKPLCLNDYV